MKARKLHLEFLKRHYSRFYIILNGKLLNHKIKWRNAKGRRLYKIRPTGAGIVRDYKIREVQKRPKIIKYFKCFSVDMNEDIPF
jgi:hypothetical protein